MTFENEIKGFFGEYRWLSNYHLCTVIYKDLEFPTSEHAYQYAKLKVDCDLDKYNECILLIPSQVQKWGQAIKPIRDDWSLAKKIVMEHILISKFKDPELRQKLKELRGYYLEETNTWGDAYWGVCQGKGSNWLGFTLMGICNGINLEDHFK